MTDHKQHSKKQMKEAGKSIQPWDREIITMKEIISIFAEKFKALSKKTEIVKNNVSGILET